jgi:alkylhydroperoxidase family enzyme
VLGRDDGSLPPRAAALARLATTLTAEPWAVRPEHLDAVAREGLDRDQVEAAITVIAMFNYFTRVADATGIEFDYPTPLPAFEADTCRVPAPRPAAAAVPALTRPRSAALGAAWQTWREYVLSSDQPLSRRERQLAAATAAEESGDRFPDAPERIPADEPLIAFARKLSREPWAMQPADLDTLRAHGYAEPAILHLISATAHQNATSRLSTALGILG